jgi:hypothetical protein
MRVSIFYIYLSFLLLFGGNYLYAETHHSATSYSFTQNLEKKQQVKHRNLNHHSSLTESDDLDEEFQISDKLNEGEMNKLLVGNLSLSNCWYLKFSNPLAFKDYSKNITIFSTFCGQSNPIYITHSVLRI